MSVDADAVATLRDEAEEIEAELSHLNDRVGRLYAGVNTLAEDLPDSDSDALDLLELLKDDAESTADSARALVRALEELRDAVAALEDEV